MDVTNSPFSVRGTEINYVVDFKDPFSQIKTIDRVRTVSFAEGKNFLQKVWAVVKFIFFWVIAFIFCCERPRLNSQVTYKENKPIEIRMCDEILRFQVNATAIKQFEKIFIQAFRYIIGQANNDPKNVEEKAVECFKSLLRISTERGLQNGHDELCTFAIHGDHMFEDDVIRSTSLEVYMGDRRCADKLGTFENNQHASLKEGLPSGKSMYLPIDRDKRHYIVCKAFERLDLSEAIIPKIVNHELERIWEDLKHNSYDGQYLIDSIVNDKGVRVVRIFTKLDERLTVKLEDDRLPVGEFLQSQGKVFRLKDTANQLMYCVEISRKV